MNNGKDGQVRHHVPTFTWERYRVVFPTLQGGWETTYTVCSRINKETIS